MKYGFNKCYIGFDEIDFLPVYCWYIIRSVYVKYRLYWNLQSLK